MKKEFKIYLEVFGIAIDENGSKSKVGMQITIGESGNDIPYEEFTANMDKSQLLNWLGLKGLSEYEITILTPKEYEERYLLD